mmetsp:Transcript_24700/g.59892  ORF Transcript_24700/g.59892 Transcript_24700/m.59892 type:complete len:224 (+) Transcript_24700:2247-2918(+)
MRDHALVALPRELLTPQPPEAVASQAQGCQVGALQQASAGPPPVGKVEVVELHGDLGDGLVLCLVLADSLLGDDAFLGDCEVCQIELSRVDAHVVAVEVPEHRLRAKVRNDRRGGLEVVALDSEVLEGRDSAHLGCDCDKPVVAKVEDDELVEHGEVDRHVADGVVLDLELGEARQALEALGEAGQLVLAERQVLEQREGPDFRTQLGNLVALKVKLEERGEL